MDGDNKTGFPDTAVLADAGCQVVRCPAEWWMSHGDETVSRHPVRRVELTTPPQLDVYYGGGPRVTAYLRGRERHPVYSASGTCLDNCQIPFHAVAAALQREWPGVEFVLAVRSC